MMLREERVRCSDYMARAIMKRVEGRGGAIIEEDGRLAVYGVPRGFVTKKMLQDHSEALLHLVRARKRAAASESLVANVFDDCVVVCRTLVR